ncbi:MAG: hypothetical protein Q4P30_02470 [Eubacteriales bacterium]|nr:hypothetical protein [Eubacteriales bacterium]
MSGLYILNPFGSRSLFAGLAVGVFVCIAALLSKGAVGLGDGLILLVIALGTGRTTVSIFLYGITIVSMVAMISLTVFRRKRQFEIPVIPFYLIGFVIQVCYERFTH